MRVAWPARRSNQSILKEISPEYSLEELHNNVTSFPKGTCDQWILGHLVVVQSLCRIRLFATPWTAACQASQSITNSWSLLKLMSIKWVMPSNHLILCHPLLLPSIFPNIRVFSNESVLRIRWPSTGVSASASVLPVNIQD